MLFVGRGTDVVDADGAVGLTELELLEAEVLGPIVVDGTVVARVRPDEAELEHAINNDNDTHSTSTRALPPQRCDSRGAPGR
jgi:hypothetical protein